MRRNKQEEYNIPESEDIEKEPGIDNDELLETLFREFPQEDFSAEEVAEILTDYDKIEINEMLDDLVGKGHLIKNKDLYTINHDSDKIVKLMEKEEMEEDGLDELNIKDDA